MYYKIKELCVKLVIYESYTKMHGQQNIEKEVDGYHLISIHPGLPEPS